MFRFIELLGRTRADVMPPIPSNQRWIARLNLFGFWLFPLAFNAMTWIFFVGDVLMTGRLLFIGAFAIYDRLWPRRYGTAGDAATLSAQGRGADSCLQRRESHRANDPRPRWPRTIPICASS